MQINEVFLFSTLYAIYRLKMLTLYRAGMITLLPRDAIRSAAYTGTAPVRYFCLETVHPLKCRGNYIATSNNTPRPLLAVPNVTAHPCLFRFFFFVLFVFLLLLPLMANKVVCEGE